jgi:hypothetical protein
LGFQAALEDIVARTDPVEEEIADHMFSAATRVLTYDHATQESRRDEDIVPGGRRARTQWYHMATESDPEWSDSDDGNEVVNFYSARFLAHQARFAQWAMAVMGVDVRAGPAAAVRPLSRVAPDIEPAPVSPESAWTKEVFSPMSSVPDYGS